ncbi:hypothetical protein HID58_007890 [Brassica napus]|uniref:Uncharacterized protein n=1 Tax=Brassica napus TaxID=3708 RepID=A0ABQ7XJK6_BRANA|nr:hypothetical protein HID58_007890 [Brassica napus]
MSYANETGVFWDFDECGHRGPVSIQIYGDLTGLDFQSSDIKLNHFHSGEKREKMTKNLGRHSENPEPSVGLLALGDVGDAGDDIVEVVELLKSQKNYSGCDRSLLGHGRMQEIPEELTAADVVPRIRQKLLDLGLRGPVSIRFTVILTGLDQGGCSYFHGGKITCDDRMRPERSIILSQGARDEYCHMTRSWNYLDTELCDSPRNSQD